MALGAAAPRCSRAPERSAGARRRADRAGRRMHAQAGRPSRPRARRAHQAAAVQVLQRLRHVQRGLQERPRARPARRRLVEQAALQRLPHGACRPAGAARQGSLRARSPVRCAEACLPRAWARAGRAGPGTGPCIMVNYAAGYDQRAQACRTRLHTMHRDVRGRCSDHGT